MPPPPFFSLPLSKFDLLMPPPPPTQPTPSVPLPFVFVSSHRGPKTRISRRRRSGSEPRKAPVNMPRAPDTCRAPRSKSFFFGSSDTDTAKAAPPSPPRPPAPLSDNGLLEDDEEEEEDNAGGRVLRISCDGGDSDIGGGGGACAAGSNNPLGGLEVTMDLWRQERREGRPQSQAFEGRRSLESARVSVSSRLSSCPVSPIRRCVERTCVRPTASFR